MIQNKDKPLIPENTYKVEFTSRCPNNNDTDNYILSIQTNSFLEAETLVEVVDSFKFTKIFQEDLIVEILKKLNLKGTYTLKGQHRRVFITSMLKYEV